MPLYEFKCEYCYKKFEEITSVGSDITFCECGCLAYRIPSITNFVVKGHNAKNGYNHKPSVAEKGPYK